MTQYTRDTSSGLSTLLRFDAGTFAQIGRASSQIVEDATLKDIKVKDLIRGETTMRTIHATIEKDGSEIADIGILAREGEFWITAKTVSNQSVWEILKDRSGKITIENIDPERANLIIRAAESINQTVSDALKVKGPEQVAKLAR